MVDKMSLTSKIKMQNIIISLMKLNFKIFKITWDDMLDYNIYIYIENNRKFNLS